MPLSVHAYLGVRSRDGDEFFDFRVAASTEQDAEAKLRAVGGSDPAPTRIVRVEVAPCGAEYADAWAVLRAPADGGPAVLDLASLTVRRDHACLLRDQIDVLAHPMGIAIGVTPVSVLGSWEVRRGATGRAHRGREAPPQHHVEDANLSLFPPI
jgi:hypothetical protein